jgi:ZIP family zinc transporter
MIEWFVQLNPVWQALIATTFTWFITALGAATVFFFKQVNRKLLDGMLGFAAGVMIAASFWSLLAPAIQMTRETNDVPIWFPAAVGFLLGGAFIRLIDLFLPHLHLGFPSNEAEGVPTKWRRSILLVLAITLHNLPLASPSVQLRRIYLPRLWQAQSRSLSASRFKTFQKVLQCLCLCVRRECLA